MREIDLLSKLISNHVTRPLDYMYIFSASLHNFNELFLGFGYNAHSESKSVYLCVCVCVRARAQTGKFDEKKAHL